MAEIQRKNNGGSSQTSGAIRQKFFNILGWLAFLLLVPSVLSMFGMNQVQEFLSKNMGVFGSSIALIIYFYVIFFLRVFFGTDQRYTPVITGCIISFLFFSNSLDIGFMEWFRKLLQQAPIPVYKSISLIAGVIVIILANALSHSRRSNLFLDILLLMVLPIGAVVIAGLFLPQVIN